MAEAGTTRIMADVDALSGLSTQTATEHTTAKTIPTGTAIGQL
ncbi:MAG TPA: hypothetical protein VGJ05_19695 [Fimbriiglobus sp.]